jgi:poly(hydroxyalkanoate) granule-associated protein
MPTKPKAEETVAAQAEPQEKEQSLLFGLLRKTVLATIGAAAIAEEEIVALINRLVERGEIAEKDGKKLVQEMIEKRKGKTTKVETEINKNVQGVFERMNIPTKADIDGLSQKITALSKKVDELKKTEAAPK